MVYCVTFQTQYSFKFAINQFVLLDWTLIYLNYKKIKIKEIFVKLKLYFCLKGNMEAFRAEWHTFNVNFIMNMALYLDFHNILL